MFFKFELLELMESQRRAPASSASHARLAAAASRSSPPATPPYLRHSESLVAPTRVHTRKQSRACPLHAHIHTSHRQRDAYGRPLLRTATHAKGGEEEEELLKQARERPSRKQPPAGAPDPADPLRARTGRSARVDCARAARACPLSASRERRRTPRPHNQPRAPLVFSVARARLEARRRNP